MSLQERVKQDLAAAMKAKDDEKKSTLRVIMGEFGRQSQKDISDEDVVKIIKKLVKSEKEVLEKTGSAPSNRFIEVAESYLPQLAGEEDIKAWIAANINFADYKNKMQAMRPIMQHFGANADGNMVKKVLSEY
jgi:uncharacterized protein